MRMYLSVIGIAMLIIATVNTVLGVTLWYVALISVIWCTALQFALDGSIAILINKMPDGWFGVDNRLYRVSQRERELYKKWRVRQWKDKYKPCQLTRRKAELRNDLTRRFGFPVGAITIRPHESAKNLPRQIFFASAGAFNFIRSFET